MKNLAEAPTERPLPCLMPGDPEIQARYSQVLQAELPGFLLRQAGDGFWQAEETLKSNLGSAAANLLTYGYSPTPFGADRPADDKAILHIDAHEASSTSTQINLHFAVEGTTEVQLTLATPSHRQTILTQKTNDSLGVASTTLQEELANSELFEPIRYTGIIEPKDLLVFTDAFNAHRFRSLTFPRLSISSLYSVSHARQAGKA